MNVKKLSQKVVGILVVSVLFSACSPYGKISNTESKEYVISGNTEIKDDSAVTAIIEPYKEQLSASMEIVLARSTQALEKGIPESTLGNFITDLCLLRGKQEYHPADSQGIDFAFLNNGGFRRSLPEGNITRGDIFELMPFENELVILTLNGTTVKKLINFMASKGGAPVSGIRFIIKNKEVANISIGTSGFDSTKVYKVLTSDYLANGGDNHGFLSEAMGRESLGIKIRDAILQHLYIMGKTEELITVSKDGRIKNE